MRLFKLCVLLLILCSLPAAGIDFLNFSGTPLISSSFVYPGLVITGSGDLYLLSGSFGVVGGGNPGQVEPGEWLEFTFPQNAGFEVTARISCNACTVTYTEANGAQSSYGLNFNDFPIPLTLLSPINERPVRRIRIAPQSGNLLVKTFLYNTIAVPPLPRLDSVSPTSIPAGSPETTLVLTGADFAEGAAVKVGSRTIPSIRVSSTQLRVPLLPSFMTDAGTYPVQVFNPQQYRSETLSLGVRATTPPARTVGSWAHLAAGENWESVITVMNTGKQTAATNFTVYDELGRTSTPKVRRGALPTSLPPSGSTTFTLGDAPGSPLFVGAAELSTDGAVNGFNIFRWLTNGQEAVVPLATQVVPANTFAFDDTNGRLTGVAVSNLSSSSAQIPVTIRDEAGSRLGTAVLSLPAKGHISFLLTDRYSETVNTRGTIEFVTPANGSVSAIGLSFTATGAFSTLPALTQPIADTSSIAHVAAGGDWESTLTLVNISDTSATAQIRLLDNTGQALAVTREFLPDNGSTSFNRTIPARSMLRVRLTAPGDVQTGSVQINAIGLVTGFVTFQWKFNGQEASVPMENRSAASYVMAFDNTGGATAGFAISNESPGAADVSVVLRDEGGTVFSSGTLSLAAGGHDSFVLPDRFATSAGKRGTVEFVGSGSSRVRALGIRVSPTGALTTLPVIAN